MQCNKVKCCNKIIFACTCRKLTQIPQRAAAAAGRVEVDGRLDQAGAALEGQN